MSYVEINPNPNGSRVGDCVIRALSTVMDRTWERVYVELAIQGYLMGDMPSSNSVWGAYLIDNGFKRSAIPDTCPDCYTVKDFTDDYKKGAFVLGTGSHAVAVIDGDYYDSWDSGDEVPVFYFERRKDNAS